MFKVMIRPLPSPIVHGKTCQSTDNGGLGIRDLYTINKSLILTATWNIATAKNQFLVTSLKPNSSPTTPSD